MAPGPHGGCRNRQTTSQRKADTTTMPRVIVVRQLAETNTGAHKRGVARLTQAGSAARKLASTKSQKVNQRGVLPDIIHPTQSHSRWLDDSGPHRILCGCAPSAVVLSSWPQTKLWVRAKRCWDVGAHVQIQRNIHTYVLSTPTWWWLALSMRCGRAIRAHGTLARAYDKMYM